MADDAQNPVTFSDDKQPDAHDQFQRWRAEHPHAFFVNCRSSGGWMLHRVGCPHPGGPDWPIGEWGSLTRTRKECHTDPDALRGWARERGQESLKECSDCKP